MAAKYRLLLSLITSLLLTSCVFSQHIDLIRSPRLPERPELNRGFTIQISVSPMLEAGSMPVRFDLQSNTKVARDRYLTLRLQTDDANVVPPSNGMQYDLTINLREGQNAYKKTYLLPKWFAGQALTATLLEDNLPLEGYEISFQVPISSRTPLISIGSSLGVLAQEIVCNWLYVDDETNGENQVPDLLSNFISIRDRQGFTNKDFQSYQELFSKRYPEHFPTNSIPSVQSWTTLQKGSGLERISTTQLVEDWRFYQRYDVILIHARNYRQLQLKQDPRYLAIRQWQLLGGTLVVVADQINLETEVSNKTKGLLDRIAEEELAEIIDEMESQLAGINLKHPVSRIFALPDPSGPDRLNYVVPAERESSTQSAAASILYEELTTGLTSSEIERFRLTSSIYHHLQTFGTFLRRYDRQQYYFPEQDFVTRHKPDGHQLHWIESWGLSVVDIGQGFTVHLDAGNQIATNRTRWKLINKLTKRLHSPTIRRGIDPIIGSSRFDDWKIPGVSEPPVYVFIGFLSMFFLFVGPITYWQTKRFNRPYLIFGIAPVLALTTTVLMFSYGIVADGFGTTGRIRQITWVDGKTKQAVERVRATYFSGSQLRDPLTFPPYAEVFPSINPKGEDWSTRAKQPPSKMGFVTLEEDHQSFDPSLLPPREQRQFVSHLAKTDFGRLLFDQKASALPILTNDFDISLTDIIVRDLTGTHWHLPSLAAGKSGAAKLLQANDASQLLGQLYINHRPVGGANESGNRSNQSRDRRGLDDLALKFGERLDVDNDALNGTLENWLLRHLLTLGEIPEGHFIATADITKDAVAIKGCELESSVHYIIGTLP